MTVVLLLLAIAALMTALLILQARYLNRLAERLGDLERWAIEQDPAAFGVFPNLEPNPPAPECPGVHPVAADGHTCADCGIELRPVTGS
jgi:hypothetical protein